MYCSIHGCISLKILTVRRERANLDFGKDVRAAISDNSQALKDQTFLFVIKDKHTAVVVA